MRVRLVVHALDRTGPPVLVRSIARWFARSRPEDQIEVVALRGGPIVEDLITCADVEVLLQPSEPWDPRRLDDVEVRRLSQRLDRCPPPDATLLVSVAAAQLLPLIDDRSPIITWVVEQGEDLHWIESVPEIRRRTSKWIAGSSASIDALARLGIPNVPVVPEFTAEVEPATPAIARRCRAAWGVAPETLLVVGAGIARRRKGPDLFLEAALLAERSQLDASFIWIGGETDDLFWPVRAEAERVGAARFEVRESVSDLTPWFTAADVFLHTARSDSFPLVCLAAPLAGTPVVGFSGVGGLTEMMGPHFLGSPYPDVGGLVAEIAQLRDPERRHRVASAQADRVRADHVDTVGLPAILHQLLGSVESSS